MQDLRRFSEFHDMGGTGCGVAAWRGQHGGEAETARCTTPADLESDDAQMTCYDMLVNLLLQFRCGKRGGERSLDQISQVDGQLYGEKTTGFQSLAVDSMSKSGSIQPSGKIRMIPKSELSDNSCLLDE